MPPALPHAVRTCANLSGEGVTAAALCGTHRQRCCAAAQLHLNGSCRRQHTCRRATLAHALPDVKAATESSAERHPPAAAPEMLAVDLRCAAAEGAVGVANRAASTDEYAVAGASQEWQHLHVQPRSDEWCLQHLYHSCRRLQGLNRGIILGLDLGPGAACCSLSALGRIMYHASCK